MSQVLLVAIVIYLIFTAVVLHVRPDIMFTADGAYKEFGVGIPGKTVFSIWLVLVAAAPISYIAAMRWLARA